MGFSLSAATAIIGVSILISIEIIVSTTIPTITDLNDSYDKMKDRAIEQVQTEINITDITTTPNASNYDLSFRVGNKGSISLKVDYFTVLIDGNQSSFTSTTTYLHPEKSAEFNIYNINGQGTIRLKVVTNNGISKYAEFTVT